MIPISPTSSFSSHSTPNAQPKWNEKALIVSVLWRTFLKFVDITSFTLGSCNHTHKTILKCEKLNFSSNCNYIYTFVCVCVHEFSMAFGYDGNKENHSEKRVNYICSCAIPETNSIRWRRENF